MTSEDLITGIDLGTTYSLVAVLQGGEPCVLSNALGERLTPSVVSVLDDGRWIVGAPARARLVTHPERTVAVFKRDMGTDRAFELAGHHVTPQDLSAMVLRQLKEDAEATLGLPVRRAVITVPAYFGEQQRAATRDAGVIAGLVVERIVNEPTAAAMAYGLHEQHRELRAVVLDLGGGTFDVTVLEIIEGVIEVQASAGDARLGGEDFVDTLAATVHENVRQTHGLDLAVDRRACSLVRDLCESAKLRLSTAELARVVHPELRVGTTTLTLDVALHRDDVEARWAPLLDRMQRVIIRALRDAGQAPGDIDEVLLVGGATRMPCVQRLATQLFGRLPLRALPPDEAVAMGAAVQSGLVAGDVALGDLVVTDVTPFTLGTDVISRFAGRGVAGVFSPILDRGTVIPCSRIERYNTAHDRQRQITLGVYQGEHPDCRKNLKLGEITIADLPARPAGEVSVDVRFTYDLNGLLEVDVIEVGTGRTQNAVFRGAGSKLTPKQIEAARAAMQRLKFHPRDALPNTTALARAEALYMALTGPARGELGHLIAAFNGALEAQDPRQVHELRQHLILVTDRLARNRDPWHHCRQPTADSTWSFPCIHSRASRRRPQVFIGLAAELRERRRPRL